jgi:hypothetical protein
MPTNPYLEYFTLTNSTNSIKYTGPEPENIKEAFLIAIAKWEFICSLENIFGIDTGYCYTCGLCMFFGKNGCEQCPVSQKTKDYNCINTPYEDFTNSTYEKDLRKHAKRELAFLKKLYQSHLKKAKRK